MSDELLNTAVPVTEAFAPGGVATAIGSLPFTEPAEALALIASE